MSVQDSAGRLSNPGGPYAFTYYTQNSVAETGLRARAQTGPVSHALALAAGWGTQEVGMEYRYSPALPDSNLYNPIVLPQLDFGVFAPPEDAPRSSRNENVGFALADTMSILDERVQLMLGIRHQKVKQKSFLNNALYDAEALSPAAALVVKPWQNVSLYANYMQALEAGAIAPSNAVNAGEIFAPYKTTQYEVGAKVDFGRVAATLAAFTATRPSYARDPVTFVFGDLLPGLPRYRATLGVEWDTPFIDSLTLGGTAQWQSYTYRDEPNTQKVDGWYRFDLSARYTIARPGWKPIIVRATLRNVLNKNYWATSNTWYMNLSEPRILLSTTFQF